jgi:hypothetical protein
MRRLGIVLGLIAWSLPLAAPAQVNKWVDEKGRVQYGDRPPAKQSSGAVQLQKAPPKDTRKAAPGKPLPVQPKNHVPGDPLVQRMKENEQRKQVEQASAECWRSGGPDCEDPAAMRHKLDEEAKARAAATKKPAAREPLPADFCKRNPKVEGCLPKK